MSPNNVFLKVEPSRERYGKIIENILNFSKGNFLTDFQVKVNSRPNSDSSGTINLNKCVLASGSSYFLEKFRENPDLNKFEISGFKLENVNKIFDFFYSDSIIINKNDLNEIVRLAKIFQLNRVLDKVFTYVKDDLNVENVLSIRDLWMSCDKMEEVKICDQFIEKNLNDISKLQIFKVIEFNYLKLLMKSNNLVVPDEKRIYEIAIEWLNVDIQTRQQFGQQLMEDVRFPLMPNEFLLQISGHEIIQNSKLIKRIMESAQYSLKKKFRIGQNILTSVDITPRRYGNVFANEEELNEHLICIGGMNSPLNILTSIEMYADLGSIWNKYDKIEPGRHLFASCTYENYIILIGGYGAQQSCTKYNPKIKTFIELEPLPDRSERNGKWRNRKSPLENRDRSTGCSVNNKFYVFGGRYSNTCEYYCPQEDTWRPLHKMKEERMYAGSCYDNNKFIYVVGGMNRNNIRLTSMERFDVEIGQWLTLKSSIGVGRRGLTLTIFKNQIILIGGRDKNRKCFNTIQKYDSISDSWSQIGILKEARAYHCTVNLECLVTIARSLAVERVEGRRELGIWKLPSPQNAKYKKWREDWLNTITKTRVVDKGFSETNS
ncbi:Kelch-like protein 8 [Nymphon striatum]|nr:Kelch-like protein 8 [Nymphon striatum]